MNTEIYINLELIINSNRRTWTECYNRVLRAFANRVLTDEECSTLENLNNVKNADTKPLWCGCLPIDECECGEEPVEEEEI